MSNNRKKISSDQNAASVDLDGQASLGAGRVPTTDNGPEGPDRPPRIRLHSGKNLHVPESLLDRENFSYRWFAENSIKGGRVASAKGAYWEFFTDDQGNNLRRPSGQDQMFLMQLEIKYFNEDLDFKRQRVNATMVKETGIGEGEYAPTEDGRPEGGESSITRTPGH